MPEDLLKFTKANLRELINFYSPWAHQKANGFLMISGGTKIN